MEILNSHYDSHGHHHHSSHNDRHGHEPTSTRQHQQHSTSKHHHRSSKNHRSNHFRRGCDPLRNSIRAQLQVKRMDINEQLNKQLMIKQGAENLARAALNSAKIRDIAQIELQFVNSALQLLKDELQEINGAIHQFQNTTSSSKAIPMIPLGLKETKSVEFTAAFKDFILEHYSEAGKNYNREIQDLNTLREAILSPMRNEDGVDLLLEYYNQLYYVDNRFFPPNRHLNVFLTWYDTLTGNPSIQRTMAFERGAILFNIGSVYTQLGCKSDRSKRDGIDEAIDCFQKAAGFYNYIRLNFSNAPSMDMSPAFLNMLVNLMIAQAQECRFEKRMLGGLEQRFQKYVAISHEAAKVAEKFALVHKVMNMDPIKEHVPYSWSIMVEVKSIHYKALSHWYVALALIENPGSADSGEVSDSLRTMYIADSVQGWSAGLAVATIDVQQIQQEHSKVGVEHYQIPQRPEEMGRRRKTRKLLGKAHLRQAIAYHEAALRIHMLCKLLRKVDLMHHFLSHAHERAMARLARIQERETVDDSGDLPDAPDVAPRVYDEAEIVAPNFGKVKVIDIFKRLGPLSIFCARNHFSAPRTVKMNIGGKGRRGGTGLDKEMGSGHVGFGFTVRGDAPVIVANVEPDSRAHNKGIREGDVIVKVNGKDMKFSKHTEVVEELQKADAGTNQTISIELVTVQGVEQAIYTRPQPRGGRGMGGGGGGGRPHPAAGGNSNHGRLPSQMGDHARVPNGGRLFDLIRGTGKGPNRRRSRSIMD